MTGNEGLRRRTLTKLRGRALVSLGAGWWLPRHTLSVCPWGWEGPAVPGTDEAALISLHVGVPDSSPQTPQKDSELPSGGLPSGNQDPSSRLPKRVHPPPCEPQFPLLQGGCEHQPRTPPASLTGPLPTPGTRTTARWKQGCPGLGWPAQHPPSPALLTPATLMPVTLGSPPRLNAFPFLSLLTG